MLREVADRERSRVAFESLRMRLYRSWRSGIRDLLGGQCVQGRPVIKLAELVNAHDPDLMDLPLRQHRLQHHSQLQTF
jgi:hypothetical protein